jgi:ketosteroid isomerase-like protein
MTGSEENMSKQAIDAGHERFLAAMRANDSAALVRELTDDVRFMPPHQPPVRGNAAVRTWYEGVLASATTVAVDVSEREVVIAGDWGIEEGHYVWTLKPRAGGAPLVSRGSYLAIWRRDAAGTWKAYRDIWNSTDPAPTAS